jgi:hypothetical protein
MGVFAMLPRHKKRNRCEAAMCDTLAKKAAENHRTLVPYPNRAAWSQSKWIMISFMKPAVASACAALIALLCRASCAGGAGRRKENS